MSFKTFLKIHFPFLRRFYRKIKMYPICSRIEKFRPYYQDELSRGVLSDCVQHLYTDDSNIFIQRAIKEGWHYPRLVSGMLKESFSADKYTGYVILDYDDKTLVDYTQKLLTLCGLRGRIRTVKLQDFVAGRVEVDPSELVIAAFSWKSYYILREYISTKNIPYDIATVIIGKNEKVQYLDVFGPVDDEIIVDTGCYDGMTALRFLEWGGSKIKHIYSLEFDPANAVKCEETLKPYADRVTLVKKGAWDKDEVMHVRTSGNAGSSIYTKGDTEVYLTTIDNIVQDERVTFIKMDIEGAELKALMGARNTIIKNHPRLAICAYHKQSDLYELPEYILSLVPEYKFLLRHYDSYSEETVLYAYCE